MANEDLKSAIQRRRYADHLRRGFPIPEDLRSFFQQCPRCQGRGNVCYEEHQGEEAVAWLEDCPQCEGDGFVRHVAE